MTQIILASNSPRRKELLSRFIDIEVVNSSIQEKIHDNEDPVIVAMSLAFQKAYSAAEILNNGQIVLAADTIVYMDRIFGKPRSEEEAFQMLSYLKGKIHYVITGIAIIKAGTNLKVVDYEKTEVKFRDINVNKIKDYIKTGEYKDKAGGYGIQGYGSVLVEWIKGSYSNVVGLPISKVDYLLEKHFNMKLL